jgi:predicted RND superfamily exporter protein
MWHKIAVGILKYRWIHIGVLAIITLFMFSQARKVELSYSGVKAIPLDHPKYIEYLSFKEKFGEDGNVMVIGVKTKNLFDKKFYEAWYNLSDSLKNLKGINEVLSLTKSFYAYKDSISNKPQLKPIFITSNYSQTELDSLGNLFYNLPFYDGLLCNKQNQVTLIAVTLDKDILNSKSRIQLVNDIQSIGNRAGQKLGIEIHYSGLPLIRTELANKVQAELRLFLILSIIVTSLVLLILLRSIYAVIFSMLVVGVAVTWSLGTIVLLGYKITMLTGLIPPLVVVIGITNCVYLLNKYHIEIVKSGNKMEALVRMIERIGLATLFTNVTAAIGFGVFVFTQSQLLKEFGLVAGLNISALFIISIIIIPCVFSLLPVPKAVQTSYLDFKSLNKVLDNFDYLTQHKRKYIYTTTIVLVIISLIGVTRLTTTGFIVDDIPQSDKLYKDLKFFESHFKGVMPLDIIIEGKDKNAVKKGGLITKIDNLQDTLATYLCFSRPISIVEAIKFVNQANGNGDISEYRLSSRSLSGVDANSVILSYLMKAKDKKFIQPFIDSTARTTRLSLNMADIGSAEMKNVFAKLEPQIYNTIDTSKYKVSITGTSVIFLEGSRFIIDGLFDSLFLAFVLIGLCMGYLFRAFKMILFSLLPNLVPLIVTAGIMGYFNIPLKPSTVLIYSIAFGIAIDNAIRFLAKYQQELHRHNFNISVTVSLALHESGISIIYTSIILFFGFIIFTASNFGGTFYLGLLTSLTLVVAMFNNLILLPSLLLTLEKWADRKSLPENTPADKLGEE